MIRPRRPRRQPAGARCGAGGGGLSCRTRGQPRVAAPRPIAEQGEAMAKSVEGLISDVRSRVRKLLHDEVIEHTIVVMRELGTALSQLSGQVGATGACLSE